MDCNKDEAVRAKAIAERKVVEKDYAGAKFFALKAENLYPGLDGLSQVLTAINVYISSEKRIGGEIDWYSVLDVIPSADEEVLRKQYRKLALVLHPDKSKSAGVDEAFKLVSEAWSLLSDMTKRLEYNQKLNFWNLQQNVPSHGGAPPAPPSRNGFHKSSSRETSHVRKAHKQRARAGSSSHPATGPRRPETFWTSCDKCKTHYEYLRIYQNHTLLCPNCNQPFLALPKAPLETVFMSTKQFPQKSPDHAAGSNTFDFGRNCATANVNPPNNANFNRGTFGFTAASHSAAAQAASVAQREQENLRRDHYEAAAEWQRNQNSQRTNHSGTKAERLLKKRTDSNSMNWLGSGAGFQSGNRSSELQGKFGASGIYSKPNSRRELTPLETRNMLWHRATVDIVTKLQDLKSKEKAKEKENKKKKNVINGNVCDLSDNDRRAVSEELQSKNLSLGLSDEPMSINVPDSDFHNFDLDRNESSFKDDQVWAAYDEDDGMPRYYARIHKVISVKPFKMQIRWLNSRTTSEFGELNWVGIGFTKTCGHFRSGRHEVSDTLNSFSHHVKWIKGARGAIHIFPQKGDVWALYRNWSVNWNEKTSNEVIHKYDMVEVLDHYSDENGMSVTPLVKIAGFRTVFRKHTDPNKVRRIQKEEMFRFSHQVPSYLLTGEEAPNAPAGCRELDPAATPLELLQVIAETDEATPMDVDQSAMNNNLQS